jgi:hypothetical protein
MLRKLIIGAIIAAGSFIIGRAGVFVAHHYGFFPEEWLARQVIAVPSYFDVRVAEWALVATLGLVLWAAGLWLPVLLGWASGRRLIPLQDAARIAYEETRGNLVGHVAESIMEQPERVLGYYMQALKKHALLFGKRPPSQQMEAIDSREIKGSGVDRLEQSAVIYRFGREGRPLYTDVAVRRKDLRGYIRWAKAQDRAVDRPWWSRLWDKCRDPFL